VTWALGRLLLTGAVESIPFIAYCRVSGSNQHFVAPLTVAGAASSLTPTGKVTPPGTVIILKATPPRRKYRYRTRTRLRDRMIVIIVATIAATKNY
jgi:hypothetical protein